MTQKQKVCSKCRKSKPLVEFYRCRDGKRGRVSSCRSCHRDYARKSYTPSAVRRMMEKMGFKIGYSERASRLEEGMRGDIIKKALAASGRPSRAKPGHGKPRPGWELRIMALRLEERRNTERLRDFGEADTERRARENRQGVVEQVEFRQRLKDIEERGMLELPIQKPKRKRHNALMDWK